MVSVLRIRHATSTFLPVIAMMIDPRLTQDLLSETAGPLLAGKMVASVGTVLIATVLKRMCCRPQAEDRPPSEESPATDRCEYSGYFSDLVEAFQRNESVGATLDMARFLAVSRIDISGWSVDRLSTPRGYAFVSAPRRRDLRDQLSAYINELERDGGLDDMIRRHLP